jgi:hypothetical protein
MSPQLNSAIVFRSVARGVSRNYQGNRLAKVALFSIALALLSSCTHKAPVPVTAQICNDLYNWPSGSVLNASPMRPTEVGDSNVTSFLSSLTYVGDRLYPELGLLVKLFIQNGPTSSAGGESGDISQRAIILVCKSEDNYPCRMYLLPPMLGPRLISFDVMEGQATIAITSKTESSEVTSTIAIDSVTMSATLKEAK